MSSGTAMARLQRGAAGADGGNDKDKDKSDNSNARNLNSGTTAGGGGGGVAGEGGAGEGTGGGGEGGGSTTTTTTATTTATTAIKGNTDGSAAPRAPPAAANTTLGGGGSSHGGGAANTTTATAATTATTTTTSVASGNNNNQAPPPRGKRCCFLWCCCCRCSCLNTKATDESRFRRPDLYNEPQPTIEEIRAWSESFEKLMTCASGRKAFRDFLKLEFSEENILFWLACEELKVENNPAVIEEKARIIYEDYISILSPKEVSLDSRVREIINRNMVDPTPHTFDEAQTQIYTLMHRDSYPRFLNSAIYKRLAQLNNNGNSGSSRKESAT